MSCCRCQTSQQQRKPHHEKRKPITSSTLFSLSYSPITCKQKPGCPPASCHRWSTVFQSKTKKPSELQGLLQHTSPTLHFGFMAKNLCLYPRDFRLRLPLPQRAVCSCCLSHSLISQVFQLFTMQAHCNWKNLKRNIKLIVLPSSASLSISVHTLQTL